MTDAMGDAHSRDDIDLTRIAAYLDGGLSAEERKQVERLLAESAEAREIAAEAERLRMEFDEAEGEVLAGTTKPGRAPLRPPRTWRLAKHVWIPLAAAAAVATVFPLISRDSGSMAVELGGAVTRAGGDPSIWSRPPWSTVRGSEEGDASRAAFRAGVRWMDLLLAWREGYTEDVILLAAEIAQIIERVPLSGSAAARMELRSLASQGFDERDSQEAIRAAESELRRTLDAPLFELGAWAEAGRVAASRDDTGYFVSKPFRGAVGRARRWDLPADVREILESVESASGASPPDLDVLDERFTTLVRLLGS